MIFYTIKRDSGFWHEYNNQAKKVNISDFEVVLDAVKQTFIIQSKNGSNVPKEAVEVGNIIVIDETDASTEETFLTVEALKVRLKALDYLPYIEESAIVEIVAGTNITVDVTNPKRPIVNATGGGGSGDVVGPASSTNNHVALFDGTTGKLLKDSGLTLSGTNTGDQDLSSLERIVSGVVASGTNTYTATYSPTIAYTDGLKLIVRFTNANSGASTLNVNALGAKSIVKGVSTALASGDIVAGATLLLAYDGTNFIALSGLKISTGAETFVIDYAPNDVYGAHSATITTGDTWYSMPRAISFNVKMGSVAITPMTNDAGVIANSAFYAVPYQCKITKAVMIDNGTTLKTNKKVDVRIYAVDIANPSTFIILVDDYTNPTGTHLATDVTIWDLAIASSATIPFGYVIMMAVGFKIGHTVDTGFYNLNARMVFERVP